MKRFTAILLTSLSAFLPSCEKKAAEINYLWTGQEEIRHFVPVCIVWYKSVSVPDEAWRPYRAFSQSDANDMRSIILRLTDPEKRQTNASIKSRDKLSLIFYNGFPKKLTVREVYFEIKDNTFVGPLGQSDTIAKILLSRKEVQPGFYYPYSELGASHYSNDFYRILRSQDSLRKQVKQIEAQKETQNPQTMSEPNQAGR
jgi:hypothetical protein